MVIAVVAAALSTATADGARTRLWGPGTQFFVEAMCLHNGIKDGRYTSKGDLIPGTGHRVGNGEGGFDAYSPVGPYYNGFQFTLYTWQHASWKGDQGNPRWEADPQHAPPWEQLHRVWLWFKMDGNRFKEWGETRVQCGLP